MSNLQTIKKLAKVNNLKFVATRSTLNGARLYNFVDSSDWVVSGNWTISSAIQEYHFGNLTQKIT